MSAESIPAGISVGFMPFTPVENKVGTVIPAEPEVDVIPIEPRVRPVAAEDLSALASIELSAFADVYGESPEASVIDAVTNKYSERMNLLGDWIRVLEDREHGVFGMMVCCPTNYEGDNFAGQDMTSNEFISDAFDPEGKNLYIVNLAIARTGRKDMRLNLFADALEMANEKGLEKAFFESRLPRFQKWVQANYPEEYANGMSREELDHHADVYWRLTDGSGDEQKPIDPLLRLYTDFGAKPLMLVKDAWREDLPSKTYGVLCEYDNPNVNHEEEQQVPENIDEEKIGFWRGVVRKVGQLKNKLIVASGVAGTAYELETNDIANIVHRVGEVAPWLASSYAGSLAVYAVSGVAMLATAGAKTKNPLKMHQELPAIKERLSNSIALKAEFWTNLSSGLAAGAIATYGIMDYLPPASWGLLGATVVDMWSTLALRKTLLPAMKGNSSKPKS